MLWARGQNLADGPVWRTVKKAAQDNARGAALRHAAAAPARRAGRAGTGGVGVVPHRAGRCLG
ncbi:hypothetical protein DVH02_16485 [Streptomyces corynorhini]|uniref:Uncharacterized protein n=1 Tax=Streptomyces corynorhini TaxID=2282652 RepID=A0A370BAA9_9ACTN|nr:hypothetical protein DVH02_16485 [Streptomyces corynorhini]